MGLKTGGWFMSLRCCTSEKVPNSGRLEGESFPIGLDLSAYPKRC